MRQTPPNATKPLTPCGLDTAPTSSLDPIRRRVETRNHTNSPPNLPIMKHFAIIALLTALSIGCSSISMPKGSSRNYKSARLVLSSHTTTTDDDFFGETRQE